MSNDEVIAYYEKLKCKKKVYEEPFNETFALYSTTIIEYNI